MNDINLLDKVLRIKQNESFDRIVPKEGFRVDHGNYGIIEHRDALDMPTELIESVKNYIKNDETYPNTQFLFDEMTRGRAFKIFSFKNSGIIGQQVFFEWLDNPHGYGAGDFCNVRYVVSEFQGSDFIQLIQTDIFHILFSTGIAKKIYVYAPCVIDLEGYDSFTKNNPCLPPQRSSVNEAKKKYVSFPSKFRAKNGDDFIITDVDGSKYLENSDDMFSNLEIELGHGVNWKESLDGVSNQIKLEIMGFGK